MEPEMVALWGSMSPIIPKGVYHVSDPAHSPAELTSPFWDTKKIRKSGEAVI
jgi:hypothetical protein